MNDVSQLAKELNDFINSLSVADGKNPGIFADSIPRKLVPYVQLSMNWLTEEYLAADVSIKKMQEFVNEFGILLKYDKNHNMSCEPLFEPSIFEDCFELITDPLKIIDVGILNKGGGQPLLLLGMTIEPYLVVFSKAQMVQCVVEILIQRIAQNSDDTDKHEWYAKSLAEFSVLLNAFCSDLKSNLNLFSKSVGSSNLDAPCSYLYLFKDFNSPQFIQERFAINRLWRNEQPILFEYSQPHRLGFKQGLIQSFRLYFNNAPLHHAYQLFNSYDEYLDIKIIDSRDILLRASYLILSKALKVSFFLLMPIFILWHWVNIVVEMPFVMVRYVSYLIFQSRVVFRNFILKGVDMISVLKDMMLMACVVSYFTKLSNFLIKVLFPSLIYPPSIERDWLFRAIGSLNAVLWSQLFKLLSFPSSQTFSQSLGFMLAMIYSRLANMVLMGICLTLIIDTVDRLLQTIGRWLGPYITVRRLSHLIGVVVDRVDDIGDDLTIDSSQYVEPRICALNYIEFIFENRKGCLSDVDIQFLEQFKLNLESLSYTLCEIEQYGSINQKLGAELLPGEILALKLSLILSGPNTNGVQSSDGTQDTDVLLDEYHLSIKNTLVSLQYHNRVNPPMALVEKAHLMIDAYACKMSAELRLD